MSRRCVHDAIMSPGGRWSKWRLWGCPDGCPLLVPVRHGGRIAGGVTSGRSLTLTHRRTWNTRKIAQNDMFRCLVLKISTPGENGYSFQGLATCTCTCTCISSAAEVQRYYNNISKWLIWQMCREFNSWTTCMYMYMHMSQATCTCTCSVAIMEWLT